MIIAGLNLGACVKRRTYVCKIVFATKFKCSDVLDNPALAHAITFALTQHANTPCPLLSWVTLSCAERVVMPVSIPVPAKRSHCLHRALVLAGQRSDITRLSGYASVDLADSPA